MFVILPPHHIVCHDICKIRRTLCDDRDGDPCIGAVPGVSGLYMAAGHSCWGILQVPRSLGLPDLAPWSLYPLSPILKKGPATGEALAQLILEGRTHNVDITRFNPARSLRVLKHASFLDPYDREYSTKFFPRFSSLHT